VARAEAVSAHPVPCWLWVEPEVVESHCAEWFPGDNADEMEAGLAVPDALWEDVDFIDNARERLEEAYGYVSATMMTTFLRAIHAELRARAGEAA